MQKLTVGNWDLIKLENLEGHWITGEEIGRHLGYSEPARSVSNLYSRHIDSFKEGIDTCVIKLMTQLQARNIRIYSQRGVLKVIRHSNTDVADKVMDEVFDVYLAVREKAKVQEVFKVPESSELEASSVLTGWMVAAQALEIPKYLAQVEAIKATKVKTGIDYTSLLLLAPAQDNIPDEVKFLEVTEIGKQLGISAKAVNSFLKGQDLQYKLGNVWKAIGDGEKYSQSHQWFNGKKSGFNLKWNVKFVKQLWNKK